jgi:ABC-type branched-subunit amino acid transport system substrate-binding protein
MVHVWCTVLVFVVACFFPATGSAEEKSAVTIVQVAPFSGPMAFYAQSLHEGMGAYFGWVNQQGGVRGRRVELLAVDTPVDPKRTLETYTLAAKLHKPTAFVYPLSPTVIDALLDARIAHRLGIPIIGTVPQMYRRRDPVDPNLFFVGVSDAREIQKIVEHIAALGMRKIAVIHWNDSTTTGLVDIIRQAAVTQKIEAVQSYPIMPDGRGDMNGALQGLERNNASAVVCLLAAQETAMVVSNLRAKGNRMAVYGPSYNDASLISRYAKDGSHHGVSISQIVPNPDSLLLPVAIDFRKHFADHAPQSRFNSLSFQGYIAARLIVQALQRCPDPKNAACLRQELESTKPHDLGGLTAGYSAGNHDGLSYVDIGVIARSGKLIR